MEDQRDGGREVKKNKKFQKYGYAAFTQQLRVRSIYVCDHKNTIFNSSILRCIVGGTNGPESYIGSEGLGGLDGSGGSGDLGSPVGHGDLGKYGDLDSTGGPRRSSSSSR